MQPSETVVLATWQAPNVNALSPKKGILLIKSFEKTRDGAILLVFTLLSVQMTVWYLDYGHCISANTDVYTVSFGEAKENNMG